MIKVLIVDDSAVVRKIMADQLSRFEDIEIVGTAVDAYDARDKIISLRPDVITLDLGMPKMDGLSFLAKLMQHHPMPVVVLSALTPKNSKTALRALDLGAVEVLCKPGPGHSTDSILSTVAHAIRTAAKAQIQLKHIHLPSVDKNILSGSLHLKNTDKVIAVGASTGGTKAIEYVLRELPASSPGVVIVVHMPENFTTTFAQRLNELSSMKVREASDGDRVLPGTVLIAPGNHHIVLKRINGTYQVRLKDGPRVHYQRPSVDVLFQSVAQAAGHNAVGVLLTGMGADGAKGLLSIRERGAMTIAQDEASCVVFGMPKEAIKLGAVDAVVPLSEVAQTVIHTIKDQ
jgi:two-component system chemotaxis response regulator CheB